MVLFITLLITLTYIQTHAEFSLPKQPCPCSEVQPQDTREWEEKNGGVNRQFTTLPPAPASGGTRIVGGYDAGRRPWAARIWIGPIETLCGGTLINKKYVLTAAHCLCTPKQGLTCNGGKPLWNFKKDVNIYLGVNEKKVDYLNRDIKGNKLFEYGVEWALAHPNYEKKKRATEDIGLYRLDRPAAIVKGKLEPICLPLTFDKSDVVKKGQQLVAYTAGWGRLFHSDCVTNELGPVKNLKCRFPFTYHDQTNYQCSTSRTPSAKDPECKKLKMFLKRKYPKPAGRSVIYVDESGKEHRCYSFKKGEAGWCKGVGNNEVEDGNWGYCQENCKYRKGSKEMEDNILASRLQETKVDVLPMQHCKMLVKKGKYHFFGKYDMCAGRKKPFQSSMKFKKKMDGSFEFIANVTDYFHLDKDGKYPFNYYVGGTDSCSGDSGGSLYYWKDGKPTLLGVTSRGYGSDEKNGCAELNFPGIYTRVARYLEWIHTNTRDGNC